MLHINHATVGARKALGARGAAARSTMRWYNYTCLVPFVEVDDYLFLKTIIPSRKATMDYLNQGEPDAGN